MNARREQAVDDRRVNLGAAKESNGEALTEALAILRRDGVVVLDDVVDPSLIARCKAEVEADYPDVGTVNRQVHYGPYEGRHTATIVLEKTRAQRSVLLPKPIEAIAERVLGQLFMMDTYGLLVSVPGAPDQKSHADSV